MMEETHIAEALARLPDYLGGHVLVSLTALALGLGVSLPLALLSIRRPVLRRTLLAVAGIIQTIPGLALLALFYPLLLALAALTERIFGVGFSALGFLPSVLALALYSMLPVLRNTITGLDGIDPAITEAARGVGMTPRQSLTMVELPLAMPVIMAGVRTAAVWVIGTATLSTPIGQTSLGNYIFTGLQTQNWIFVLFGCVAAALLALAVDQLLGLMESGAARRNRRRVAIGAAGLVGLIAAAFLPSLARQSTDYIVGAKPFSEQYVLAALIQQRLADRGLSAGQRDGLGSALIFDALAAGEIDVYVEYTGTLWATQMRRSDVLPRQETLREITTWLKDRYGIVVAGGLGFENAYALAMTAQHAKSLSVRSIDDLAAHASKLTIAGDYEFFGRPEWKTLRSTYGLSFKNERTMQPEFMYPAAEAGEVEVIAAHTSDGRIARHGLVVLDDPRQAIPPYDAIVLVSRKRASDRALLGALQPLTGAIDVAMMREANLRAAAAETSPTGAARWLWAEIERRSGQKK
jgi:osmoprotectant transport system permease protein